MLLRRRTHRHAFNLNHNLLLVLAFFCSKVNDVAAVHEILVKPKCSVLQVGYDGDADAFRPAANLLSPINKSPCVRFPPLFRLISRPEFSEPRGQASCL
jgi:hypothetical protein